MKRILKLLSFGLLLVAVHETCCAAIALNGMSKPRAEKELGLVIKREFLGAGATNEAGISIEFSPKDNLPGFLFMTLAIYAERQAGNENFPPPRRRLTSVTLRPIIETKEKVRAFFCVDPAYLDRTEITIRVSNPLGHGLDGYVIWLDPKDFPNPPG